nr:LysR family transcriptional regulator [Pandoraea iniqua]
MVALRNTRSFVRAAALRHVTQSGFSRRIQALEAWARQPLVDREVQPVRLTPAGERVFQVATRVLAHLDTLAHELHATQIERHLRIAAPHLLSQNFFPHWIPRIRQRVGGLNVAIQSLGFLNCLEQLSSGEADLVAGVADVSGAIWQFLPNALRPSPEQIMVVGHDRLIPLSAADQSGRPIHEVGRAENQVLDYWDDCSLNWSLAIARQSWPPQRMRRIGQNRFPEGLRLMALSGMGAAWLPESMTGEDRAKGMLVPAASPDFFVDLDIVLIWPKGAPGILAARLLEQAALLSETEIRR